MDKILKMFSTIFAIAIASIAVFAQEPPPPSTPQISNSVRTATTTSLANNLLAKNTQGNLYGFYCGAIAGAAGGNCIAVNANAVPGTGALTGATVLDMCTFDTSAKGCSLYRNIPRVYSAGIVILCSSAASPFTYTTGTDTCYISADFQ